jgi:hypothetical protein
MAFRWCCVGVGCFVFVLIVLFRCRAIELMQLLDQFSLVTHNVILCLILIALILLRFVDSFRLVFVYCQLYCFIRHWKLMQSMYWEEN